MPRGDTTAANRAKAEMREGKKVDKDSFAALLGRSVSWVEKMTRAGMPVYYKGSPGRPTLIDTAKAYDWLIERAEKQAADKYYGRAADPEDEDVVSDAEARRRINVAKAEQEELKLRKRHGEVAEIAVMEAAIKKAIETTRKHLLFIPTALADELATVDSAAKVKSRIETEIHEALHELSSIDTTQFVTGEVLQSMGAAADTDSE